MSLLCLASFCLSGAAAIFMLFVGEIAIRLPKILLRPLSAAVVNRDVCICPRTFPRRRILHGHGYSIGGVFASSMGGFDCARAFVAFWQMNVHL